MLLFSGAAASPPAPWSDSLEADSGLTCRTSEGFSKTEGKASAVIGGTESGFKLEVWSGLQVVVGTEGNEATTVADVSLGSVSSLAAVPGFAREGSSGEVGEPGCGGFTDWAKTLWALLLLSSSVDGKETLEAAVTEPDRTGAGCIEGGNGTFFRPQAGSGGVGILASKAEELSLEKEKQS